MTQQFFSLLSPSSSYERSEPPTTCDTASSSRCLLVHRFSLWILYRQRLLAFCADNIKTGGGELTAYSREHISRLCPGPPAALPLSMHAIEWNSLNFNGLPMLCSHLHRAIWTSDCYCLSSLLSSPLSQVCLLSLSFATVVSASSARLSTINDHISLSVGIADSLFSLLFADSSCCVHRMFLSCQYHACSWTKDPSRSPFLPLHPLATLLSYCMLPYYTLLTLVLPISPTCLGAVLHRFELPTFIIHAAHSCRPWWSTATTADFSSQKKKNAQQMEND